MTILALHGVAEGIVAAAERAGLPFGAQVLQAEIANRTAPWIDVGLLMLEIARQLQRNTHVMAGIAARRTI